MADAGLAFRQVYFVWGCHTATKAKNMVVTRDAVDSNEAASKRTVLLDKL
jgi:hypothetical protein